MKILPEGLNSSSTTNTFINKLLGFSVVVWVSLIVSFISAPISTRLYAPEELGKINLFSVTTNFILLFAYIGIDQAFVRFYYEPPEKRSVKYLFSFCFYFSLLAALLSGIIVLIVDNFYPIINTIQNNYYILVLLFINTASLVILRYLNLAFRMQQDVKMYTFLGISMIIASKFIYLLIGLKSPTYIPALTGTVLIQVLIIPVFFFKKKLLIPIQKFKLDKKFSLIILKYGVPLFPVTLLVWVDNSIAPILLKKMLSFEAIGIYSAAVAIVSLINIVQNGFNTYWQAYIYENYKTQTNQFYRVHKSITFVIVIFGLILISSQDIIFLILGEKYRSAKEFFPFLLVAPICYTIAETTGLGINISKKTYLNTIPFLFSIIVNLSLAFFLIPFLGISGAAIASASGSIFSLAIKTYIGEKYYVVVSNYFYMIFGLFVIIAASSISMISQNAPFIKFPSLFVLFIITLIVYRKEFFELLKILINTYSRFNNKF
ncbi:MAG TPA: lipopolysaccharide biosynthesis protein [Lutibacter sp.]